MEKKRKKHVPSFEKICVEESDEIEILAPSKKRTKYNENTGKQPRKKKTVHRPNELDGVHAPIVDYLYSKYKCYVHSCPVGTSKPSSKFVKVRYKPGHPDIMAFKRVQTTFNKDGFFSGLAIECKRDMKAFKNCDKEHLRRQAEALQSLRNEGWYACFVTTKQAGMFVVDCYMHPSKHHLLFKKHQQQHKQTNATVELDKDEEEFIESEELTEMVNNMSDSEHSSASYKSDGDESCDEDDNTDEDNDYIDPDDNEIINTAATIHTKRRASPDKKQAHEVIEIEENDAL